jgi:(p)ppGpp synthase/HD superfamily hydrolase
MQGKGPTAGYYGSDTGRSREVARRATHKIDGRRRMTEKGPRFNSARFREALIYAAQLHAAQPRKGTDIPYVAHLLGVASIVIEYGADEDEAIAALLHDAAEDQGGKLTLERIRMLFGGRVAAIVDGCTDTYEEPKPDWAERKARYIVHLRGADRSVRLVSAADKLHNARSILKDYRDPEVGMLVFDRFKKETAHHTLWYYRRLADEFMKRGPKDLAGELHSVVKELERAVGDGGVIRDDVYRELDAAVASVKA